MSVARGAAPGIECWDGRAPQEISFRGTPYIGAQRSELWIRSEQSESERERESEACEVIGSPARRTPLKD
jgi:hypothetical protein